MDNKIYYGKLMYHNYRRRGMNTRFLFIHNKKNKHGKIN